MDMLANIHTHFVLFEKVMKKNKRERDEDSVRHGDQYDTQLLWFLMRHMRNRRPARVRSQQVQNYFLFWGVGVGQGLTGKS